MPQQQQQTPQQQQLSGRARHELSDHITGEQPVILEDRTRSGATSSAASVSASNQGVALCSILRSDGVKFASALEESSRVNETMAVVAALRLPEGLASMLPPEPTTMAEMQDSPERNLWESETAIEM